MKRELLTQFSLRSDISSQLEIYKLLYWEYPYFIGQLNSNAGTIIRHGIHYEAIMFPQHASWHDVKRVGLSFRKEFGNETGIVLCTPCN